MAFRFKRKEELAQGVLRIASSQLDKAIEELRASHLPPEPRVHQVRKRMKKLRALANLAASGLGDQFPLIDGMLRDAGKRLSGTRDADVRLATVRKLGADARFEEDIAIFSQLEARLLKDREAGDDKPGLETSMAALAEELEAGRSRYRDSWVLSGDIEKQMFSECKETLGRGAAAMEKALRRPTDKRFHRWRKHMKNHYYQLGLFSNAGSRYLLRRRRMARVLTELLGDDHDLAVLMGYVDGLAKAEQTLSISQRDRVASLVTPYRQQLQREAIEVGEQLSSESPSAFKKRLKKAWRRWRRS